MKVLSTVKGKVMVGALTLGIFGAGAAAGASYDFGSHLAGIAGNLSSKASSFVGKTVDERQALEAKEVSKKVTEESTKAAVAVGGHTLNKTNEAMNSVNAAGENYKTKIENAFKEETKNAKDAIDAQLNLKLAETDGDLDTAAYNALEAAKNEADKLANKWLTDENAKTWASEHAK